jgi:hypothetical protein
MRNGGNHQPGSIILELIVVKVMALMVGSALKLSCEELRDL